MFGFPKIHEQGVLVHLKKNITALRSERTALTSLRATLCKFKFNKGSCKERLFYGVTFATVQLNYAADCALEESKRTLIAASTEEQARLKKLDEELRNLGGRQTNQIRVADEVLRAKVCYCTFGWLPFPLFELVVPQ
ncbi:unnamed protein product [Dibothriocephalus latus]|uniref:Uncharacterized protein n=1 Tax=Dibothriocephalus latus TaxID=60516 RepID=A0A3P7Q0D3_DIBLA|nr:unnamed protein product [Dibothriocephalus latus]